MADATQQNASAGAERHALRALLPFLAPYRLLMVLAILALTITATLALILPMAVRRVIDNFGTDDSALLDIYFAAAIGIAALMAVGTALRYLLVTKLGERVVTDIRNAVFARMIRMSPGYFETIMTGEVLSRMNTDTTLVLSVIGSSISIALRNILMLSGGLVLMLFTSVKLTLLVLLGVPLVLVPILTLGRKLRSLSKRSQELIADATATGSETLLAASTVQAFAAEARISARIDAINAESLAASIKRINARALMTAIVIFLTFTGIVGVLWIGANDVREGQMSAGQLVQFVIYSVMVAGAVAALSEVWGEVQRASGASARLAELIAAEDPIRDPEHPRALPQPKGSIRFEAVSFTYPSRPAAPALSDVDFTLAPGETVALVGPSGAGKSTILQLLLRFYDPASGRILLDGCPITDLTREDLRRAIAFVSQDPVIFAASAAENIRFSRPDASDADLHAAADAAAALSFIEALPEGFNTKLGERGVLLSGGQRQRIAIARAILRDAPVLLLDEATSALDAESERAVQSALEHLSANRTTLVIAHRLATVKKADRILVLDQGRIIATGTHESLVAEGGLYARLAKLQFADHAERL